MAAQHPRRVLENRYLLTMLQSVAELLECEKMSAAAAVEASDR